MREGCGKVCDLELALREEEEEYSVTEDSMEDVEKMESRLGTELRD